MKLQNARKPLKIKKNSETLIAKGFGALAAGEGFEPSHTESESAVLPFTQTRYFYCLSREHACYYTKMAQNVNRKMKKI